MDMRTKNIEKELWKEAPGVMIQVGDDIGMYVGRGAEDQPVMVVDGVEKYVYEEYPEKEEYCVISNELQLKELVKYKARLISILINEGWSTNDTDFLNLKSYFAELEEYVKLTNIIKQLDN